MADIPISPVAGDTTSGISLTASIGPMSAFNSPIPMTLSMPDITQEVIVAELKQALRRMWRDDACTTEEARSMYAAIRWLESARIGRKPAREREVMVYMEWDDG